MSQQDMGMEGVRADLARTTELAKLLFEQQFIRCGGRMPADPTWDEIEEVERDEWFERAVDARPLLESVEASRRDWAALAMLHDMYTEHAAVGTLDDPWPEEPGRNAPCSCLTPEQAAVVVAGGFSLPRCAVHPEADR